MEVTLSVLDPGCLPVSRLSANDGLSADDLFLVTQPVNDYSVQAVLDEEFLDAVLLEEYGIGPDSPLLLEGRRVLRFLYDNAWKLRYADLSARLLSDISARFGFKSMAYREEWQYSLANHSHPYTSMLAFAQYTYKDVRSAYSDRSQCLGPHEISEYLGTVEVWGLNPAGEYMPVSTDLYMPHLEFPKYPEPDIGEMRILARDRFAADGNNPVLTTVYSENDMLYDEENGGYWVYPDGQTINCPTNEFMSACAVYGPTPTRGDTSFTVPLVSGFIKPFPGSDLNTALKRVDWQNGLLAHSDHKIDNGSFYSGSNTLFVDASISTYENGTGRGYVHAKFGKDTSKIGLISANAVMQNIENSDGYTDYSDQELDIETLPRHHVPACIVYIGRRYS